MAKGVMRKFKLNEISAVDRPAQAGAVMTIIKRDGGAMLYLAKRAGEADLPDHVEAYLKREFSTDQRKEDAKRGIALPDGSFPIANRADLRNAVRAIGRAKNRAKAKAHIVSRARALGATDSLPEDWKVTKARLLADVTNAEAMEGFSEAVEVFKAEQAAVDFNGVQADAEACEYANGLLEEVDEAVCSLRQVFMEIEADPEIGDKQEALQESLTQFKAHIQGIIPEGIENAMAAQALVEAGFEVNEGGALTKLESDMGIEAIKKSLKLSATANDADVTKAVEAALAKAAFADAVMKMSDKHAAFMNHEKAKMPKGGKEAFAEMTPEERDSHMEANPIEKSAEEKKKEEEKAAEEAKKRAGDEVLKVDGREIRKSAVGEDTFAVLKSQQLAIEKAEDIRLTGEIEKRARASMEHIGKAEEIASLVRKVQKGHDPVATAEAICKKFEQIDAVLAKSELFAEIGSQGAGGNFAKAADEVDALAKQLVADGKAKNIYKARTMVRDQNPELRKREEQERAEATKARAA